MYVFLVLNHGGKYNEREVTEIVFTVLTALKVVDQIYLASKP